MTATLTCRMKSYIQPFERELALQELRVLSQLEKSDLKSVAESDTEFRVATSCKASELVSRLAYWETIADSKSVQVTLQSLRESTVNLVRNGVALDALRKQLPFVSEIPLPNRRCLRYGTHGIHEYRGKFFPQLVRALVNIAGLKPGDVVGDPMSGSGTTVAEALLMGCFGRGIDMNPLSVLISKTKSQLLSANAEVLVAGYEQVRSELLTTETRTPRNLKYLKSLPAEDQRYLKDWFSEEVLSGLDDISLSIANLHDSDSKALARVALSNIIRSVSWQKNDDLRVRKEIRLDDEIDPKR